MNDELKELETITKEYLNKIDVLLKNTYKKENITYNVHDIENPYKNIDNISIIHDIETARSKVWEILSGMGKFNTIKKYNFTPQELRILLLFDYFTDAENITDLLQFELNISKRTAETHIKNIANKITDILAPYIKNGEIDYIETNENNNAVNPKFVINCFLWELWHYLIK